MAVLILHNTPNHRSSSSGAWLESDAGVIDEVRAVEHALAQLGIPHRTAGVGNLDHLRAILSASHEAVVFNLVESLADDPCDHALVPAICRPYGMACTGGDTPCLLLAQDKWRTHAVLRATGLSCPPALRVEVDEEVALQALPSGPLIVKPACSDASEGIDATSVFNDRLEALIRAVQQIHEAFGQAALIESFVGERELNVSVMERNGSIEVLPIAEIDFSAFGADRPKLVGYSAKWKPDSFEFNNTPRILPAQLKPSEAEAVRAAALAAWNALGCRDYARVDMRLDSRSQIFVLEVNPNPDISPEAGFAAAVTAEGLGYETFVEVMVANALNRTQANLQLHRQQASPMRASSCEAIVRETRPEDIEDILSFLESTGRFRPSEVVVAREVLEDAMRMGLDGPYRSLTAEGQGRPIGWTCFGPTPCTEGTCDIDWLAVAPEWQKRGIASVLVRQAEKDLVEMSCRMIVVQTSSRPDYDASRAFYVRHGYHLVSRLPDFYAHGDDLMVYVKRLPMPERRSDDAACCSGGAQSSAP